MLTVTDVMTAEVVTVAENMPFKAIATTLAENHISAVPVRDKTGRVVGVVSETDLLRKEEFQRTSRRWFHHRARTKAQALTAGRLMTRPPITVEGSCTLDQAARLMAARRITRLVVMDGDKLIGIVTRSDLLSAFLAPDREILARVRRDVVDRHLWDDPFGVAITVMDGVVRLRGQAEKRSTVVFAEQLIAGVDGVVGVDSELTWAFDDTQPATGSIRPLY